MMSATSLKFKYNTLAEIQENMKNDFETQNQKKSKKYLEGKPKRNRKESLEASMRLTGNTAFLPKNRHRYPEQDMGIGIVSLDNARETDTKEDEL